MRQTTWWWWLFLCDLAVVSSDAIFDALKCFVHVLLSAVIRTHTCQFVHLTALDRQPCNHWPREQQATQSQLAGRVQHADAHVHRRLPRVHNQQRLHGIGETPPDVETANSCADRCKCVSPSFYIDRPARMAAPHPHCCNVLRSTDAGGHGRKMLLLDLDETLVYCKEARTPPQQRHGPQDCVCCDFVLRVMIQGRLRTYHVYHRPHVHEFLQVVSQWYNVHVYTASLADYANPVIDSIDRHQRWISGRHFRDACVPHNANFLKDLTRISRSLCSCVLVDNSDSGFALQPDNGVPIRTWRGDMGDVELVRLLPLLDALRGVKDVRSILQHRNAHVT